jgi:4-aminobutyrate---pyruvate transaminase
LLINERVYAPLADESAKIGTFGHGFTASGHPVAAAVALENLAIIEERDLVGNVRELSPLFMKRLKAMEAHPLAVEARGVGLIGALELHSRDGFAAGQLGPKFAALMLDKGVIGRAIGDSIALCPPLIVDEQQINTIFDTFEASLDAFAKEIGAD